MSTFCLQFVYNLSSICPNFFLVLSEFCHNKNKTKQRQTTNCRQFVDNLSFVFVLSYFCIQFVICLYFVLFLLWQNSDKTKKKLRQIVDKLSPNCRQIVDKLSFVFVCSQGIRATPICAFYYHTKRCLFDLLRVQIRTRKCYCSRLSHLLLALPFSTVLDLPWT